MPVFSTTKELKLTKIKQPGFPGDSVVKNLLPMQEMWVPALGWEDPLEKEMAIQSSILAWKISWTEELVGHSLWGRKRVKHNLVTKQQSNS